jgi:ArsR family transcriptional regulator, arsenate/arsenite/antimonite-responsive transcriptional repressor
LEKDLTVLKALSDETRLRTLLLLSRRELCVCEIVAVLDMPQGKVSRHLSVLRHAGLVVDRREGLWIYYSLRSPETPLTRMVTDYLSAARKNLSQAIVDQNRLEALVCDGEVCAPKPSPALVQTSVSETP